MPKKVLSKSLERRLESIDSEERIFVQIKAELYIHNLIDYLKELNVPYKKVLSSFVEVELSENEIYEIAKMPYVSYIGMPYRTVPLSEK